MLESNRPAECKGSVRADITTTLLNINWKKSSNIQCYFLKSELMYLLLILRESAAVTVQNLWKYPRPTLIWRTSLSVILMLFRFFLLNGLEPYAKLLLATLLRCAVWIYFEVKWILNAFSDYGMFDTMYYGCGTFKG